MMKKKRAQPLIPTPFTPHPTPSTLSPADSPFMRQGSGIRLEGSGILEFWLLGGAFSRRVIHVREESPPPRASSVVFGLSHPILERISRAKVNFSIFLQKWPFRDIDESWPRGEKGLLADTLSDSSRPRGRMREHTTLQ